MIEENLDRHSAEQAEGIMSALCPSKSEQRVVLGQLLRSINVAEQYAPNSWAVTLFGNGFRLNVGPVEVYTFFGSEVRLFLLGTAPIEAQQHGELFPTDFYSVPQPQSFFTASVSNFDSVAIALQSIHGEFVHAAAVTSKGAPRKASSFARSHSPGLLSYAKHVVSENSSVPTEHQTKDYYFEGAMRHVSTNVDERNRTARDECVKTHGSTCVICGFNFQASYGAGAAGVYPCASRNTTIHNRSSVQAYKVNPVKDLVPLCPNCHSVVHLVNPPHSIEQVKNMFLANQAQ